MTEAQKTVVIAAAGFAVMFFLAFYVLSRDVAKSLMGAVFGGGIVLVVGLLVATKSSTGSLTGRRTLLFVVGLVGGYIVSGFVLGPGVLAVLVGVLLGVGSAAVFAR